jgi:hypothetical protein
MFPKQNHSIFLPRCVPIPNPARIKVHGYFVKTLIQTLYLDPVLVFCCLTMRRENLLKLQAFTTQWIYKRSGGGSLSEIPLPGIYQLKIRDTVLELKKHVDDEYGTTSVNCKIRAYCLIQYFQRCPKYG